ncbi:MAG TPA: methylmalonyl-CoA mutase family protein, partial [Acidimicrobiales bacterium]|nr:methylmalonyl-CoA mutase family protein [Acidimicrobiales bacterium]
GVLGGTQSLHTDSFDEALALPTEKAARIALRTQQVVAEETGVVHVADPLGGSWFVESLTDELERQAEAIFAHLEQAGSGSMLDGVVAAIEEGWFQGRIADAAYDFQRKLHAGRFTLVGVNGFTDGDDDAQPPTLYVDPVVEERQLKRLADVKASRSSAAVDAALARLREEAAEPDANLMPALIEAARAYATVGEAMHTLEGVFGTWTEP